MPVELAELVDAIRKSRSYFLKHLRGLIPEQLDWKPYAECKSIRETVGHLIVDDRAALESLQTRKEPEYDQISAEEMQPERLADFDGLLKQLSESHTQLCGYIESTFAGAPLDSKICVWGDMKKLIVGVPYFASEDFYHAGQVAYIRIATDPSWDYYCAIYGPG